MDVLNACITQILNGLKHNQVTYEYMMRYCALHLITRMYLSLIYGELCVDDIGNWFTQCVTNARTFECFSLLNVSMPELSIISHLIR